MITLRVRSAGVGALAVSFMLLASFASCKDAMQRVFQQPQAEFRGVRLGGVALGGGTLDVTLLIRNPNPYRLTATGAQYRLLVDDSVEVGHGVTADTVSVGARDSATVHLPLDVDWASLQRALRGAARDGEADYRIVGQIRAQTPLGGYDVPLSARGRAKVPRLFR
jgi:LEA14-like dessication related protein